MAYGDSGDALDLTSRVRADGFLDWTAPAGRWTLYALFAGWHGKLVERAAPGGEGNVIDHFSRAAIRGYLAPFDRAFAGHHLPGLRAFFNDSYEVDDATGQADWTPSLFEEFQRRRGYDLRRHLPALVGPSDTRQGRPQRPRSCRLSRDHLGSAARHVHGRVAQVGGEPEAAGAQPGARRTGQPPRSLRGERHSGDRGRRNPTLQVGDLGGARGRSAARLGGSGNVARRTFPIDARGCPRRRRSILRRRRQSHLLPRHGLLAGGESHGRAGSSTLPSSSIPRTRGGTTSVRSTATSRGCSRSCRPARPITMSCSTTRSTNRWLRAATRCLTHFGGANPPAQGTAFEEAAARLQRDGFTYDFISDRQILASPRRRRPAPHERRRALSRHSCSRRRATSHFETFEHVLDPRAERRDGRVVRGLAVRHRRAAGPRAEARAVQERDRRCRSSVRPAPTASARPRSARTHSPRRRPGAPADTRRRSARAHGQPGAAVRAACRRAGAVLLRQQSQRTGNRRLGAAREHGAPSMQIFDPMTGRQRKRARPQRGGWT